MEYLNIHEKRCMKKERKKKHTATILHKSSSNYIKY